MYEEPTKKRNLLIIGTVLIVIIIIVLYFFYSNNHKKIETNSSPSQPVSTTPKQNEPEAAKVPTEQNVKVTPPVPIPLPVGTDSFVVALKDTNQIIATNLFNQGYVTDQNAFTTLLSGKDGKGVVVPGGYKISKEMSDLQLVQVLKGKQYMKWVVIPEGLRKEEIAKLLSDALGWTTKQKNKWIKTDTTTKPDYIEGVYFPDTYLIPTNETTEAVAARLISKFNENFASYLPEFTAKNIKWTKALTLASIVQREAANDADAPLIAGILWNRLNQNMQLDVDATLQYIRGDKGAGFWAPITVADKKIDSPYNTYLHTGLPPHPISNPGLPAIDAVLNPTKTDCLYYLHDKNRVTHCAATYPEHQANILKYLK